jgi:hypothetical protein
MWSCARSVEHLTRPYRSAKNASPSLNCRFGQECKRRRSQVPNKRIERQDYTIAVRMYPSSQTRTPPWEMSRRPATCLQQAVAAVRPLESGLVELSRPFAKKSLWYSVAFYVPQTKHEQNKLRTVILMQIERMKEPHGRESKCRPRCWKGSLACAPCANGLLILLILHNLLNLLAPLTFLSLLLLLILRLTHPSKPLGYVRTTPANPTNLLI